MTNARILKISKCSRWGCDPKPPASCVYGHDVTDRLVISLRGLPDRSLRRIKELPQSRGSP